MTKKKEEIPETLPEVVPETQPAPTIYEGPATAENLMLKAIDKGVPVETMERLLAMRRELQAEAAKRRFDEDMAAFQGSCPTIKKTKEVKTKSGQVAYRYAPIESIVAQVKEKLNEYGFSYAVKTETEPASVKSTVIAKHKEGHSEESSVQVPLGNKTDIMSQTQVVAAALTFAKRYAFCNAFGILTGDDDDDAQSTKAAETPAPAPRPYAPSAHALPRTPYTPPARAALPNDDLAKAGLKLQIDGELHRLGKDRIQLESKIGKRIDDLSVQGLEQVWNQLKDMESPPVEIRSEDDGIPTIINGEAVYPPKK